MRYYRLFDELYFPENRWFLGSLNVVENEMISVWRFTSSAKIELPDNEKISINIRENGQPLDFTFADFEVMIVNEKVAAILSNEDCQLIPVEIEGVKNGHLYFIAVTLNSIDCVDEARSDFEKWEENDPVRPDKAGEYKSIYKLFVDGKRIDESVNMFRLKKYGVAKIINEKLKKQLEKNGVTGVRFLEVT